MNPYWEELSGRDSFYTSYSGFIHRRALCKKYTWAIPDPKSLDFVAKWSNGKLIEIGAGAGYWAWQLSMRDVNVLAYDVRPPHMFIDNGYHSPYDESTRKPLGELREIFFDVRKGAISKLSGKPDRTLFLCWPPMTGMAVNALRRYRGNRIIYIGEDSGGCTANDDFFGELSRNWKEVGRHNIKRWNYINDRIEVYERNKP